MESSERDRAVRAAKELLRDRDKLVSFEDECEQNKTREIGIQTNLTCESISKSKVHLKELEEESCEMISELALDEGISVKIKRLEKQINELRWK